MMQGKLPLVAAVDSDMDAKAVIRRMRLHQKAPSGPERSDLDVSSFNDLVKAAKSDLAQQEAASKNELEYYRSILEIKKPLVRPMELPTPSTVKLPSLKPVATKPAPTNQERPSSSTSSTSSSSGIRRVKAPPAKIQPLTKAAAKSVKPPPVEAPPVAKPSKRLATKTVGAKVGTPAATVVRPNNAPVPLDGSRGFVTPAQAKAARKGTVKSTLDCVADFDTTEPEVDSAPVWHDDGDNNNGYGSDQDPMLTSAY
ncbi:hypothetical protein ACHHYP_08240 [Achlya hypogyna]|uniref:Uncharacterized protein n=1 Tax=Achlya hypogyna TaxID=1202772 RepID=A0A1V9ZKY6_ACHHY|nr:hypothetical protein ACHHYP_08240 [Achlya hypogyna]